MKTFGILGCGLSLALYCGAGIYGPQPGPTVWGPAWPPIGILYLLPPSIVLLTLGLVFGRK